MKELKKYFDTIRWIILQIPRRARFKIVLASAVSLLGGVLAVVIPVIFGKIPDKLIHHLSAYNLVGLLAIVYLVAELLNVARRLLVERTATNLFETLSRRSIKKLLHLDYQFLLNMRQGAVGMRVNIGILSAVKLVKLFFADIFPSLFIMSFAIISALSQNLLIGLTIVLLLPINFFVVSRQLKNQKGIRTGILKLQENIHALSIEMLGGIEEIRAANQESESAAKVNHAASEICKAEYGHHRAMGQFDFTKGTLKWGVHLFILGISIMLAANQQISIGDVLKYSMLYLVSIKPIEDVHRFLDELQENSIRAKDLIELLEDYPEDESFSIPDNPASRGTSPTAIEVNNLHFTYAGTETLINALTVKVPTNTYVGIVGNSGCGKSSLIKCLLNLQSGKGNIFINGVDLKKLSRKDLSELIAYIPQNSYIFNDTLRANILFGSPDLTVSDEKLWSALKLASLYEWAIALPFGLDTVINERGSNISGGQKQRINFARLFLNDHKPIVILDEATASIDNLTESQLYKNLLSKGRTIISVAHRLSTLVKADEIIVLGPGAEILESGTFDELRLSNREFTKLLKAHHLNAVETSENVIFSREANGDE